MWEKRRAWLAARMPAYTTEEAEAPKLEGSVTNSAGLAGVTIGKIIPIEHSATAEYQKIGVGVTAFGSNEEIIRFLSLLQSRDAFRLMPTVKITPDKKDPSIVNVELTLNQLYSLETVAVPEPETQPESENPPVSGEPNVVKSESAPATPQPVVTQ